MFLISVLLASLGFDSFRSGEPWLDSRGMEIDAHGGGMLLDKGTYYWYGSKRRGHNGSACCDDGGINLYSSRDLYNWDFESTVVPAFSTSGNATTGNGLDLERPKVVRCASTGKYVMWLRGTGYGNTPQLLGVATADTPTGPFTFEESATPGDPFHTIDPGNRNLPVGYQYADATLFQDPRSGSNATTYVYWRTRVNPQGTGFRAMRLTEDCLGVVPNSDTQLFQSPNREAPAVFFAHGQYYLWTSGTDGWNPTNIHLYTADTPLGAFNASGLNNTQGWLIGWQPQPIPPPNTPGNMEPVQPGQWAFGSQSTYILPNPAYAAGSSLAPFVYMADRWKTAERDFGTYVWLPLFIDPKNTSRVRVTWATAWRLDNATSPFV